MNKQNNQQMKMILGDEYDKELIMVTKDILKELGGETKSKDWGMGGSQEIETIVVDINGMMVTIESETYIGLSITGEASLVTHIASLVKARLGRQ